MCGPNTSRIGIKVGNGHLILIDKIFSKLTIGDILPFFYGKYLEMSKVGEIGGLLRFSTYQLNN